MRTKINALRVLEIDLELKRKIRAELNTQNTTKIELIDNSSAKPRLFKPQGFYDAKKMICSWSFGTIKVGSRWIVNNRNKKLNYKVKYD